MDHSLRGDGARLDRRSALLGAAALGAGALAPACCPCAATTYQWNNAIGTNGVDPEHFVTPKSLAEIVDVVKKAESEGKRVKMTGSGHSFSDVALTEDYLLSPMGITRALPLDVTELRQGDRIRYFARVEAGITIRALNAHLDAHGYALTNLGGYDAQTIVGAAMTGTHGSGLEYGPIASQIASLELVTKGGEVLKVEPENGITRVPPKELVTPFGKVPVHFVPDTKLFNALTVSLGCMGIVYAIVIEVVPTFWLREKRTVMSWGELCARNGFLEWVMNGAPRETGRPHHYEIYVSPYPRKSGQPSSAHPCLLTQRFRDSRVPTRSVDERVRGKTGDHILVQAAKITKSGQALAQYMNDHPNAVADIMYRSIKALEDDKYVNKSFKVFNLGPLNAMRSNGIEMAFELEDSIKAVERLFTLAGTIAEEDGHYLSSPPSLRFVKAADADIAMANGRPTATLELGSLACANGSEDMLERFERTFIEEFNARPHWGLDRNVLTSFDQVVRLYGESAKHWRTIYEDFNERGTFDGAFTDRLGISKGKKRDS